jgi:co-chaperonin GroES (HSP10)
VRLRPVRQWLTVTPIEVSKVGTLYAPESAVAQYRRGRVVDVPDKPTEETEGYKTGDVVVYDSVGAIQLRINNKTFHALKGREIVGVLEDYTED